MSTRNGKIGRLPKAIRQELNRRLDDGEPGKQLVGWLNGRAEVREVLEEQFGGRAVNEQNLSEWKQGGYRDWQRHQETCERVRCLAEQAEDLEAETEHVAVSDRLATRLAAELATVAENLIGESADAGERWQRLRELLQELGQLRRDDHRAARLRMEEDRWQRAAEGLDAAKLDRQVAEAKHRASAPLWAQLQAHTLAPIFGGGETGWKIATLLAEMREDLPAGTLSSGTPVGTPEPAPVRVNQTQSKQIKPNQGPHPAAEARTVSPSVASEAAGRRSPGRASETQILASAGPP